MCSAEVRIHKIEVKLGMPIIKHNVECKMNKNSPKHDIEL